MPTIIMVTCIVSISEAIYINIALFVKLFVSQFALLYTKCTVYFSIMINFSLFLSCLIDGYTECKLLSYCKMFNYHHVKNIFTTAVHIVLICCKYNMHSHLLCMYTVGKLIFTSHSVWCVDDYS